jgi:hypothetical protein
LRVDCGDMITTIALNQLTTDGLEGL